MAEQDATNVTNENLENKDAAEQVPTEQVAEQEVSETQDSANGQPTDNTPDEALSEQVDGTEEAPADEAEETSEKEPKKKKKGFIAWLTGHKHWKATLIVIVVVVVAAGAGFYVWHNTPEFCDAICHNPQDPYNPTYYAEPGQQATDKWGNTVTDASSMLAATHRVAGKVCVDCHKTTLGEQITEGFHWVTGNFYNPLSERSIDNLTACLDKSGEEFCLNENCHNLTKSDLTALKSDLARNPHAWHHSEYTCSDCHKSHRASIMVCSECHSDSVVPDSWLSVEESRNLTTIYGAYDLEELYKS